MKNKWIIFNLIVAVIGTGWFLITAPHEYQIFEMNTKTIVQTLEIIPLEEKELICNAIKLFMLILSPSIIYVIKNLIKKIIIGKHSC